MSCSNNKLVVRVLFPIPISTIINPSLFFYSCEHSTGNVIFCYSLVIKIRDTSTGMEFTSLLQAEPTDLRQLIQMSSFEVYEALNGVRANNMINSLLLVREERNNHPDRQSQIKFSHIRRRGRRREAYVDAVSKQELQGKEQGRILQLSFGRERIQGHPPQKEYIKQFILFLKLMPLL